MKRTPLKRSRLSPKRKAPVKKVNSKRRAKRTAEQFGPHAKVIRALPCCVCGSAPPSTAHHTVSRAAGGLAKDLVPLCVACHSAVHGTGQYTFDAKYRVNLRAIAAQLWEERQWAA